jgi:hypothetical protein
MQLPSAFTDARSGGNPRSSADGYTGVVLIHGIGREKRNETLQESLNALTYWYNHKAGLALRPNGPGRVWLRTNLDDSPDLDADASCATIELSAPSSLTPPLRLELREVWWAESFGLPSPRSALRWARIQFRQEAARILLPIGVRLTLPGGPRERLRRRANSDPSQSIGGVPLRAENVRMGVRLRRAMLRMLLAIYSSMQDAWKMAQWILGMPLLALLLQIVGVVRLLAPLPGFSTLLKGFEVLVDAVSLHWIASMQVYLLDYTRSTSLRQRFEREFTYFLRDPNCARIVVLAHSMGTVVAYEGLTSALAAANPADASKPITYVCLAQALRRIWMLARTDPHRLRGVLPSNVRWLHFWARYDPVAAGDLKPTALPRLRDWTDLVVPNPDDQIRASLARCENYRVVNQDSIFFDHTSYWQNLDEVVARIARVLVTGHPELEQLMESHSPTVDDVLKRRWQIAWRATLAILSGIAVGVVALYFGLPDARLGHAIGSFVKTVLGLITPWGVFLAQLGETMSRAQFGQDLGQTLVAALYAIANELPPATDLVLTLIVTLILIAFTVLIFSRIVAPPSPFVFKGPAERVRVIPLRPGAEAASNDQAQPAVVPAGSPAQESRPTS